MTQRKFTVNDKRIARLLRCSFQAFDDEKFDPSLARYYNRELGKLTRSDVSRVADKMASKNKRSVKGLWLSYTSTFGVK